VCEKDPLKVCQQEWFNNTHVLQLDTTEKPDVDEFLFNNYFCEWEIDATDYKGQDDFEWIMRIYRYFSNIATEKIEVVLFSGIEVHYDDEKLRSTSYKYTENGPNNQTSEKTLEVKRKVDKVKIYAKNT